IGLVPDAEVQPLAVDGGANCRDAVHVSPVHADEVDSAIARATRRCTQRVSEEGTELRFVHLARRHSELAMAFGGHRMPADLHIVGRIEESRIDTRPVADDSLQKSRIAAIAASHPMLAENPDITRLRSWRCRNRRDDVIVWIDGRGEND